MLSTIPPHLLKYYIFLIHLSMVGQQMTIMMKKLYFLEVALTCFILW
jgi:hypothetical protein